MGLRLNISIKNNIGFFRFKGELDESTINDVRKKICEIIEKYKIRDLVFNLKELEFLDSSGIGLILGRYQDVKKDNGQVVLCELNDNIEKIISFSGLLKICALRDCEESARWFLGEQR